jgi:hypothetical protein
VPVLTEQDILKLTKVMGRDLEVIAKCLQLSENEIAQIKSDHQFSSKGVIHNILLEWKNKLGRHATLEKLEESLRDAVQDTGAYVDWDAFNQAKEAIRK